LKGNHCTRGDGIFKIIFANVLIAAFIGLENSHFWRIAQDTTCVNRFHLMEDPQRVRKTWNIISIDDACHLRGMKRGTFVDF